VVVKFLVVVGLVLVVDRSAGGCWLATENGGIAGLAEDTR
jgi:hypothetical protein